MASRRGFFIALCLAQLLYSCRGLRSHRIVSAARLRRTACRAVSAENAAESATQLQQGDVVTVVGCTGNVGRLVTARLASMGSFSVRGVCRSLEKGEACFDERLRSKPEDSPGSIRLFEGDTRSENPGLREALTGASAVIVTTGTTAFPTKAWAGGNTPENVDNLGVKNVIDTWISANADGPGSAALKRFVLMSSVGVTRRAQFPFVILNLGGVLNAKAAAEEYLMEAAAGKGFDYTIVRPGQLFGGPYDNNYYLGTLLKLDKDANSQNIVVETGDKLLGDTLRSTTAEALATALELAETRNTDFVVVNKNGPSTSEEEFRALFKSPSFFGE